MERPWRSGEDGPSLNSGRSSPQRDRTGYSRSSTWLRTPERGAANCSTYAGPTSTSTPRRSPSPDRPPLSEASVNGITKSGRTRVVCIDDETAVVLRQRKNDQTAEQLKAGDFWRGTKDGYVFTTGWGEPIYPPIPSHR